MFIVHVRTLAKSYTHSYYLLML